MADPNKELIDAIKDMRKTFRDGLRRQGRAVGGAALAVLARNVVSLTSAVETGIRSLFPKLLAAIEKLGATAVAQDQVAALAGDLAKVGGRLDPRQIDALLGAAKAAEERASAAVAGVKERALGLFGKAVSAAPGELAAAGKADLSGLADAVGAAVGSQLDRLPQLFADALKGILPVGGR